MGQAKTGDTVRVNYTGQLSDGTVFDSTASREPLQFTIGQGQVIRGFEQAVVGMAPGQRKTSQIPAEAAYGPHQPERVFQVGRERMPKDLKPEVGQQLMLREPGKEPVVVRVAELSQDGVTIDANHPLAGKDLTFEIEMVEIK